MNDTAHSAVGGAMLTFHGPDPNSMKETETTWRRPKAYGSAYQPPSAEGG